MRHDSGFAAIAEKKIANAEFGLRQKNP